MQKPRPNGLERLEDFYDFSRASVPKLAIARVAVARWDRSLHPYSPVEREGETSENGRKHGRKALRSSKIHENPGISRPRQKTVPSATTSCLRLGLLHLTGRLLLVRLHLRLHLAVPEEQQLQQRRQGHRHGRQEPLREAAPEPHTGGGVCRRHAHVQRVRAEALRVAHVRRVAGHQRARHAVHALPLLA